MTPEYKKNLKTLLDLVIMAEISSTLFKANCLTVVWCRTITKQFKINNHKQTNTTKPNKIKLMPV